MIHRHVESHRRTEKRKKKSKENKIIFPLKFSFFLGSVKSSSESSDYVKRNGRRPSYYPDYPRDSTLKKNRERKHTRHDETRDTARVVRRPHKSSGAHAMSHATRRVLKQGFSVASSSTSSSAIVRPARVHTVRAKDKRIRRRRRQSNSSSVSYVSSYSSTTTSDSRTETSSQSSATVQPRRRGSPRRQMIKEPLRNDAYGRAF